MTWYGNARENGDACCSNLSTQSQYLAYFSMQIIFVFSSYLKPKEQTSARAACALYAQKRDEVQLKFNWLQSEVESGNGLHAMLCWVCLVRSEE